MMSFRDGVTLIRPRIVFLVALTTSAGFYMSSPDTVNPTQLLLIVLGISLITGAAGTLNQYMERDVDALMERTAQRPIPSGRVKPSTALAYGILLALLGTGFFWWEQSYLALGFAHLALFSYLWMYTPLKKITPACTLLGAIPGALPPLIGSVAAVGEVTVTAWILFGILYLWQIPHFLAIAWMYKDDYAKANLKMLPVVDESGKKTARQIFIAGLLFLALNLSPFFLHLSGKIYFGGAILLSLLFQWVLWVFWQKGTRPHARRIVLASVFVLPLIFVMMVLNKN